VKEELAYYIPNSFTPDNDEINNVFLPVFKSGFDPNNYSLLIFNRWGQIVFESHDVNTGWDGNNISGGEMVQDGTYTWKIEFKAKLSPQRKIITGHVNVLR
jgi:gliding motility-associated-like protein